MSSNHKSISLLVRNLNFETSSAQLREFFRKFGDVRDVYLPTDYHTGKQRGFGFVEFFEDKVARSAMKEVDGNMIDGNQVSVMIAQRGRKSPDSMRRRDKGGGDRYSRRNSRSFSPAYRERRASHSYSPYAGRDRRGRYPSRSPPRGSGFDRRADRDRGGRVSRYGQSYDDRRRRSRSPERRRRISPERRNSADRYSYQERSYRVRESPERSNRRGRDEEYRREGDNHRRRNDDIDAKWDEKEVRRGDVQDEDTCQGAGRYVDEAVVRERRSRSPSPAREVEERTVPSRHPSSRSRSPAEQGSPRECGRESRSSSPGSRERPERTSESPRREERGEDSGSPRARED